MVGGRSSGIAPAIPRLPLSNRLVLTYGGMARTALSLDVELDSCESWNVYESQCHQRRWLQHYRSLIRSVLAMYLGLIRRGAGRPRCIMGLGLGHGGCGRKSNGPARLRFLAPLALPSPFPLLTMSLESATSATVPQDLHGINFNKMDDSIACMRNFFFF